MLKKIEIFLRKVFHKIFFRDKNHFEKIDLSSINKILLIRLNRIGDALITTPFIRCLRNNSNATIDILADKKNYFIFENNKAINRIVVFNKNFFSALLLIRTLRRKKYDLVIDLHDDVSTTVSVILKLINSNLILGLAKNNSNIYTHTASKLDASKTHVVDRLLNLMTVFNVVAKSKELNIEYYPAEEDFNFTENFLSNVFISKKFLIGINISAGSDARFWGIENFKKLFAFLNQFNCNVILLTDSKDLIKAQNITNEEQKVFYTKSFSTFSAMISQLDFLFTPDTSIVHIASVFKVPVFGLYVKYQTNDIIWYPYKSDFEKIITLEETLNNVSFDEVKNKLKPFLEKKINEYENTKM